MADRVGSSHLDFDPEAFKAKFQANKGKVYLGIATFNQNLWLPAS